MSFDFYEGHATHSATAAEITVRRGGVLVLTAATVEMLGKETTHVKLGFDPGARAIGLKAAPEGARGAYRLRAQSNSVSRLVDGKRLFAHHGLSAEKARRFDAEDFGNGVVGFRLPEKAEMQADAPKTAARSASKSKPRSTKK